MAEDAAKSETFNWGKASLGLSIAGAGQSATGAYSEAQAAKTAYQYNATVEDFNAKLADDRAEDASNRGLIAEHDIARGAKQLKGKQVAAIASSGIALGSGTALDILAGTDLMAEVDIATVRSNAQKEVFAEESEALERRIAADFARLSASEISPGRSAVTSLINSSAQVAGQWYSLNK